ncbi:SMP-30/gluconolactonase/LRE family protein [Pseudomonas sp. LS44]|uniref:SMP-30/gluconolactonase/LRE family protein n=1 Tax=Pseudomonas sp. LS44 TaxID=1357074 RepID=UPI00215B2F9C|nr:SMP-30/gluconolactonase/LRE family protein [Pseudomonas sp. LS44]UVE18048.1 SMP-30/gluconolactonase/LRE family protein [Pseudomonas sp. LS44]
MSDHPCPTLTLVHLAELQLSAASAVVCQGDELWIVADDALVLQRYSLTGEYAGKIALLPGELPADAAERKAHKPDFEALAHLPDGSLLALGSGSTAKRRRGCLLQGEAVRIIDLSPLYQELQQHFVELNLEGAVVFGEDLLLAQRGNGAAGENAVVLLDLPQALADLAAGQLSAAALRRIVPLALGDLDGVPLGLTDLAVDPHGRLYCSAAAEASGSTYLDGDCAGSVLARFDKDLHLVWRARLAPLAKIEGLAFQADGRLLLVADADDPQRLAPLFALDDLHRS